MKKKEKKITLKQIANIVNVSQNTVSNALRGFHGVNEETRKTIIQTARDLGYNFNLNSEKNTIIIAAMPDKFNDLYFFAKISNFLEVKIAETNYKSVTLNNLLDDMDLSEMLDFINEIDPAGIIVFGEIPDKIAKMFMSFTIPVVYVGCYIPNLIVNAVIEDNIYGVYSVVSYLMENGYKKIGFIGDINENTSFWERYFMLIGCLKKLSAEYNEKYMIDLDYSKIIDYEYMAEMFESIESLPEVFICADDRVAAVAIKALYQIGKNVPEDIGIVGFDNSEISKISIPTLTTVDTYPEKQGAAAFNLLERKIKTGDSSIEKILSPVKLIPGGSTRRII